MELVKLFKKALKEKGLSGRMRAQRAGCLDACERGPSIAVYPEGIFYGGVKPEHVRTIVEEHLIGNRPVEPLIIDFSKDVPADD
jgi:(2Fe-2S) ferredoxin